VHRYAAHAAVMRTQGPVRQGSSSGHAPVQKGWFFTATAARAAVARLGEAAGAGRAGAAAPPRARGAARWRAQVPLCSIVIGRLYKVAWMLVGAEGKAGTRSTLRWKPCREIYGTTEHENNVCMSRKQSDTDWSHGARGAWSAAAALSSRRTTRDGAGGSHGPALYDSWALQSGGSARTLSKQSPPPYRAAMPLQRESQHLSLPPLPCLEALTAWPALNPHPLLLHVWLAFQDQELYKGCTQIHTRAPSQPLACPLLPPPPPPCCVLGAAARCWYRQNPAMPTDPVRLETAGPPLAARPDRMAEP
jgi:hypothetical protein